MRPLLWICLLSPGFAASAFGWGCDGHQIVALIARARLTPETSAAVDALLKANPIDAAFNPFCKNRPDDAMADIASWADDMRTRVKNGPWHFIDIPRAITTRTDLDPWCPAPGPSVDGKDQTGCVVKVIAAQLAILRDKSTSAPDRANALRYIIHFVGDIHQPLHTTDDAGGNCATLRFSGDDRTANLHSIWDTRLIQEEETVDKQTVTSLAETLNSKYAAKFAALSSAPVDDAASWAWKSHGIALAVTYGNLEPGIPVLPAGAELNCAAEREQVQALNIVIGAAYIGKALPAIDEQLATAGFRLARLLNSTLN